MKRGVSALRVVGERGVLWLEIAALVFAGIAPALLNTPVEAAQLTSRSATISTSEINASDVQFTFDFTIPTAGQTVGGIIYEFCTNPVGSCTLPSNMDVQTAGDYVSQTGWPDNATGDIDIYGGADVGDCTYNVDAYMLCFSRDEATYTGTTTLDDVVQHVIDGIEAPDTEDTVYVRIFIYDDNDFGSVDLFDSGTVAAAFVNQLTVTGRVTERLDFCVAALTRAAATPADCGAFPSDTEIAIGVIDNADVYISPVPTTANNLANDKYGAAMIRTNAAGGVVLTYYPEPATNVSGGDTDQLRSFRVLPTDCSAADTSLTDQCFRMAADGAAEDFSAFPNTANERFGMHIPCIDTASSDGLTANLGSVPAAYAADGTTTHSPGCEDTTSGDLSESFAFNVTGNPITIASSSSVVNDEMVKIRFGAVASPVTPEGSYLVVITYIATPTF